MKFGIITAIVAAFVVMTAISFGGCYSPSVGGNLSDSDGGATGIGEVQQGSHFLSQAPCDDQEWYCGGLGSHLYDSPWATGTQMHQMWLPRSGGGWTKITMIYDCANGWCAIWRLNSQYVPSYHGTSTSWCLEMTPTDFDSHASWRTMNPVCGSPSGYYGVGGTNPDGAYVKLVGYWSSEGQTYPVLIQPYVEIEVWTSWDGAYHDYKTVDGITWTKAY